MAGTDSYIWKSLFPESPRRRPCHRSKQAACRHQGQIYVYGGRDGNKTLRDFWRYDILTNIWTRMECGGDTPPPLQEHTMIAQRGCLFIFGGELGYGSCGETPLWIYSIAGQTWEKPVIESEVMSPTGRRGHSAVVWRGGMHVYGGYVDLKGSSSEMWTLDFESRWWHLSVDAQLENSPSPRHLHSAVAHESNMWVYGGLSNLQPLRDLWKWNFESRQWSRVRGRQSPSFLYGHSAVRVVGSMMIFGGEDSEGEYRNELWKFNFGSTNWHCTMPNRRIAPTSCTRHVMLSIPSNQIVNESYMGPPADDLRPQSAPTQAHLDRNQEVEGAGTPHGHLADLFVLRPHSSPPVVGTEWRNEDRRVHYFVNRVHPSPDDESDPRMPLFDSDEDEQGDAEVDTEDRKLITVAAEDDERNYTQGDRGGTVNGKWAVAMVNDDARAYRQRDVGRMENKAWAVTKSVSPVDVDHVEEKEMSKLPVNEESPVHHHHGDRKWIYQDEARTDPSSSLQLRDGEWILEDVLSEPSSPVPSMWVPVNGRITSSAMQDSGVDMVNILTSDEHVVENHVTSDGECNNFVEAENFLSQLPKNETSNFKSTRLNNNDCNIHNADSILSSHSNNDAYEESCYRNVDDIKQGNTSEASELSSIQEPEEPKVDIERICPSKADVICVRPLDGEISENINVKVVDNSTDRQKLLSTRDRSLDTFVNYGFMSSHEDLRDAQTPQVMDFKAHQSGLPRTIVNGRLDQSDGVHVSGNQSGVTVYAHKRQVFQSGNDAFHQSRPPALIVNGEFDQSDVAYQTIHQSQAMLYQRKHQATQSEQTSHQRVIHVKPTNQRVCQISVEEQGRPHSESNTRIQQLQQNQRPVAFRGSSKSDSRPRLHVHGRSQTLNSLPDRNQTVPGRLQRLGVAGQSLRRNDDQQLSKGREEEDEDKWAWPVFLYLMGGDETGSCSLHQNTSPMSLWKCCIVRGKPSDSEIQHILSQY